MPLNYSDYYEDVAHCCTVCETVVVPLAVSLKSDHIKLLQRLHATVTVV